MSQSNMPFKIVVNGQEPLGVLPEEAYNLDMIATGDRKGHIIKDYKAYTYEIVTTNPEGLLHKSKTFQEICTKYGYTKSVNDVIDINQFEMNKFGLEQPRHTIRTNNGTELASSHEILQTTAKHGYTVESTTPDSSTQHGMAE